ncbi:FAD-binding domain-containing protein [Neolentinus lepideus HHB14362 ss-1]|uniref:FAD-binding domain-containing protein n=1 Tax=Neolentinus lepideus HHB14362 ss-1 TaxID=1314782 RepID=A0A165NGM1_9AGAM|nr:FAD-binding domain-containing protein [Neolentinus lepideus HHB14362 ss-1]
MVSLGLATILWYLSTAHAGSFIHPRTPSPALWEALNMTVNGHLHVGVPFSRPCFVIARAIGEAHNKRQCDVVLAGYHNHSIRTSTFGAYINTQWETCQASNEGCVLDALNASNPQAFQPPACCFQGSIPSYYIDVQEVNDVQAAIKFSEANLVPLVIKNSGHDYKGRSSAPNSLALWVHNLQGIQYHQSFSPDDCHGPSVPAVTFGAGVNQGSLYEFAEQMNITIPGGTDTTVAAGGGYLQGGGHSTMSNVFGLAVDRVIQYRVVIANGTYVIANKCQHPDLFFALRGGGGGTFGVVMEVTTMALPRVSAPTVYIAYNDSSINQAAFLRFMIQNALSYAKQGSELTTLLGWGGYIAPTEGATLTNPLLNGSEAQDSLSSLKSLVLTELQGQFTFNIYPSYLSVYNAVPIGYPYYYASRLIPVTNFESTNSQEQLFSTLLPLMHGPGLNVSIINLVAPFHYGLTAGTSTINATSITPAWRNALWHVMIPTYWNYSTPPATIKEIQNELTKTMAPLRDITPESGAYINECDIQEPNFSESFWGDNYNKLLSIKNEYDPSRLFDCWQCVGWKGPDDPRYACYL